MIRFVVLMFVIGSVSSADHEHIKDCSRVEFCSRFRNMSREQRYEVDKDSVTIDHSSINVEFVLKPIQDTGLQDLTATLSPIESGVLRLQISEIDSNRYQLSDVLDGTPKPSKFEKITVDDPVRLELNEDVVLIYMTPFKIVVVDKLVLNGDQLIMEKEEAFAFGVTFPSSDQLYGIHEHADNLVLRNTTTEDPYRLRNLDVAHYEIFSTMSLYGAIPVVYGHGPNHTAGIFLHNAAEQWIDVSGNEIRVMVESGSLDLFILLGPRPAEVVKQYVGLTGTAHLPQLWALGYHQCRWNYENQSDVKDVVANFDSHGFQLDAIWLDIEYTDGKRYFTWNPENFSDPVEMQQNLSLTNRKLVTIIDPHIKIEKGYKVYDGALEKGLFVKNPNGSNFEGVCWPGLSSYMDFLNPEARAFYGRMYSYENFEDSTEVLAGIWNDMNEPSVFNNSTEMTMPGDAVHFGGVRHRDIHNIYGFLHTMSTHQGLLERDNGAKRPFILTRSHFAGSQRYTAFWTGDNTADWDYILISYSQCLNANMLGMVFCGADVGGFFGDEPNLELIQRWYQAGAWLPFYRAHANMGTKRREPYLFSEEVQTVIRNAIRSRYAHLPTWYTLFYEHTRNRDPIIRPLFYHYPSDSEAAKINNQLLLGADILVAPVVQSGAQNVSIYFPGNETEYWFAINTDDVIIGGRYREIPVDMQSIPVYYRAGSVIVRQDAVKSSATDMINEPNDLYVILDTTNQKAQGTIYLDDYESFKYRDNKDYNYFSINANYYGIAITKIDGDGDLGDFSLNTTTFFTITIEPTVDQPGKYKKQVFPTDVHGNNLKDLKFDSNQEMVIKFT